MTSRESEQTDYVLGTEQDELERLKFQHDVWRQTVVKSWQDIGIRPGSNVVDLGAGPGYATFDLSDIVGPSGQVHAVERSENFTTYLQNAIAARGTSNIIVHKADLLEADLPIAGVDATWSRWVCSFLHHPDVLIAKLPKILRPGGIALFYEYVSYQTWQMLPNEPMIDEFTSRVITTWKKCGGETNVAPQVVASLRKHGFEIINAKPHVFAGRPDSPYFAWTAAYMRVNTKRSLAEGQITSHWAEKFLKMIDAAEADPNRVMITPMVLEIVAKLPLSHSRQGNAK